MNDIFITIDVAGRHFVKTFSPLPNLAVTFPDPTDSDLNWDGTDVKGILKQGIMPVVIRIGYDYKPVLYTSKSAFINSFLAAGSGSGGSTGLALIPATRSQTQLPLIQPFVEHMGSWDARGTGLGGWTLDIQHTYDPSSQTLYLGDGDVRTTKPDSRTIDRFAGAVPSDGPFLVSQGPKITPIGAKSVWLDLPEGVAQGPNGCVYIADQGGWILQVTPKDPSSPNSDAQLSIIAGGGTVTDPDYNGPALNAALNQPTDVAVGPDGSLFISESGNSRVRRLKNGNISSYAGCYPTARCPASGNGDNGLAINASFQRPPSNQPQAQSVHGLAVAMDGAVYVADQTANRIRRIGTDGIITTFAGNGNFSATPPASGDPDNIPATKAAVVNPHAVGVGSDGAVYFGNDHGYLQRVTPDGLIHKVAGSGHRFFGSGLGDGPALGSGVVIGSVSGIAVAPDGSVAFSDAQYNVVRIVDPSGTLSTVAGVPLTSASSNSSPGAYSGDGGPSAAAELDLWGINAGGHGNAFRCRTAGFTYGGRVAFGSDGSLYVADLCNYLVRKISPSFPTLTGGEMRIASEDGSEVYFFDPRGKHERTVDALTGNPKYTFNYDTTPGSPTFGRLVNITYGDRTDGKTLTIQYDPDGVTRRVVAPFGQTTTVALDGNGFAQTISNAMGEKYQFGYYGTGGLLQTLTDPRGFVHTFEYESDGRLKKDSDPMQAGGSKTLTRLGPQADYTVDVVTALNRDTKYEVATRPGIDQTLTTTEPSGGQVKGVYQTNGAETVTMPDGSTVTRVMTGDARFGMQSPIIKSVAVSTGRFIDDTTSASISHTQTISPPTLTDPLSFTSVTDSFSLNGATPTSITYDAIARTLTRTSPMQRTTVTTLDAQGRVISATGPGSNLAARSWVYNSSTGVLSSVSVGSRTTQLTPATPEDGLPNVVTAPDTHSVTLQRDAVGRILHTLQTASAAQGDAGVVTLDLGTGYDSNSNLSSVTPSPGALVHSLLFNSVNLLDTYTPPAVGSSQPTHYHYNQDRQLDTITRPDNSTVTFGFESTPNSGRVSSVTFPNWASSGTVLANLAYDPVTRYLQSVSDPGGETVTYGYDKSLLTSIQWSGLVNGTVLPLFDKNFRLASTSFGAAAHDKVEYTYDLDGLLMEAKTYDDAGTTPVPSGDFVLTRDAALPAAQKNGLLTATSLGVVSDVYGFDAFAAPSSYTVSQQGNLLFQMSYPQRDGAGRLKEEIDTVLSVGLATHDYTYDPAGRLTDATCSGSGCPAGYDGHYVYDLKGNRSDFGTTWTYDGQDRLTARPGFTYAYNTDGALLTKTAGIQSTSYTYDALGNLRQVVVPGSPATTIDYIVDGFGRRVGKKKAGTLVQGFLYQDGLRIVAELDGSGNIVSRFVYGTKPNVPDFMLTKSGNAWTPYRIVSDHLGSVRRVVDATNGSVAQKLDYDAWGNVLVNENPVAGVQFQPFGFAGGLFDVDTGLVHFGARDYDPAGGRWTAKDPVRFGGGQANLYVYVANDPVNRLDPVGLWVITGQLQLGADWGIFLGLGGSVSAGWYFGWNDGLQLGFVTNGGGTTPSGGGYVLGAGASVAAVVGISEGGRSTLQGPAGEVAVSLGTPVAKLGFGATANVGPDGISGGQLSASLGVATPLEAHAWDTVGHTCGIGK